MVGLSAMFPRVEVFLIQGSSVDMLERPPMDGERNVFPIHTHKHVTFLVC